MITIDNSNYELWLVRYADGALTGAEREAVEQWLEGHPEAAAELEMYTEAPRLENDETIVFGGTIKRRMALPQWSGLRWQAAAAALAAIVLTVAILTSRKPVPEQVAQAEVPVTVQEGYLAEEEAPATQIIKPSHTAPRPVAEALPEAQPMPIEVEDHQPTYTTHQTTLYVNDLIVYAEPDDEETAPAVAEAYTEVRDEGISMPRLVGSLLKAYTNR